MIKEVILTCQEVILGKTISEREINLYHPFEEFEDPANCSYIFTQGYDLAGYLYIYSDGRVGFF